MLQVQVYFVRCLGTLPGNDSSSSLSGGSDDLASYQGPQSKTELYPPSNVSNRHSHHPDSLASSTNRCRIGNMRGTHSDSELPEDESDTETSSEEEAAIRN